MLASRWLVVTAALSLLACGADDSPRPIADSGTPPGTSPPAGTGGSGGGVGAPGDPAPGRYYAEGEQLDASLAWSGYAEGSDELGTLALADFHDPTGALGIHALLITEGQADCAPCLAEAKDIAKNLPARWQGLGIRVVQLLVSNVNGQPATSATALAWKNKVKATWGVGVDPNFTFAQSGSNPYPIQVIVDPRTLTIVRRIEGYQTELPDLEALAEQNQ